MARSPRPGRPSAARRRSTPREPRAVQGRGRPANAPPAVGYRSTADHGRADAGLVAGLGPSVLPTQLSSKRRPERQRTRSPRSSRRAPSAPGHGSGSASRPAARRATTPRRGRRAIIRPHPPVLPPLGRMRAGAVGVDITPDRLLDLEGYGDRQQPATGTLDRLEARALVLEDGPVRAA